MSLDGICCNRIVNTGESEMIDLPHTHSAVESLSTALATNNPQHRAIYLESLWTIVRMALVESASAPIIATQQDMLTVDAILAQSKIV